MDHVVMKHKRTTLERAEKFISPLYFTDVNLHGRIYPKSSPVTSIQHYAAPGRITYEKAIKGDYSPAQVGQSFGPSWSTHWFCVEIDVPSDWMGKEVRLRWNSNSEALIWVNGQPVQGFSGENERTDFILTESLKENESHRTVHIEMACNGLFGTGDNGMINPPNPNRTFTLSRAEVAVFDRAVYNLVREVELLHDMARHLPEGSERGYQALYTVNQMINAINFEDRSTFEKAHKIAQEFLSQKNGDSQHVIHAMGHCHIDTAWLWPYAETIRKCARSWSNSIRLMEKYKDFTFTCSQAQQYEWVKQHYPGLFEEIKTFVKRGQFIPVGASWVEMDGNIPSGEAFVRQFLFGQRFFQQEFGLTCKEFWLPDTFGYSAQLPQIMRQCGVSRFLTQKMSWSLVNKFPHHTFWWEGIDGSKVLTHFPPGDSYAMKGLVKEVLHTMENFRDKGRSGKSVYLFGFGDGGQGPSEDMLERLKRMKDVDGLARVRMSSPDEFFSKVEMEDGHKLCRWAGELYLELHNGTYTTHAKVKQNNRNSEFLLHNVEFYAAMAVLKIMANQKHYKYPAAELSRLWKLLLLNQFHDVLPGSSIGMVYEDAHAYYKDITESAGKLINEAQNALIGSLEETAADAETVTSAFNSLGWERVEVVCVPGNEDSMDDMPPHHKRKKKATQLDSEGNVLAFIRVPSYGYQILWSENSPAPVTASLLEGDLIKLENSKVMAVIDKMGRVIRMSIQGQDRNAVCSKYPANQFVMYDDIPLYWDAWDVMDYHLETRKPVTDILEPVRILDNGPIRASVKFALKISKDSTLHQNIILDADSPCLKFETQVSWHESHKFLKVEFPTSVHTYEATYEIQYGHLKRPNHYNTSWDSARFEVCGHKWADLSECGYGVAILNDCKYGYSAIDNILRLSLLRSPKAPDANADMGEHIFKYALMPHLGSYQESGVIQEAYNLNCPLSLCKMKVMPDVLDSSSFLSLSTRQVVIETVKMSEDGQGDLILRMYEAFGGQAEATLTTSFDFKHIVRCNCLEEMDQQLETDNMKIRTAGRSVTCTLCPFQILTLRITI
ncbi:hypothetical protein ACJMK2_029685 [Sinanodonta woodiana]|uniref:alpha-mannosidase n=1 Tax=Sinanodonta woodiana TaxID=1069815 RepID=A0ABD3XEK0_SINWO